MMRSNDRTTVRLASFREGTNLEAFYYFFRIWAQYLHRMKSSKQRSFITVPYTKSAFHSRRGRSRFSEAWRKGFQFEMQLKFRLTKAHTTITGVMWIESSVIPLNKIIATLVSKTLRYDFFVHLCLSRILNQWNAKENRSCTLISWILWAMNFSLRKNWNFFNLSTVLIRQWWHENRLEITSEWCPVCYSISIVTFHSKRLSRELQKWDRNALVVSLKVGTHTQRNIS